MTYRRAGVAPGASATDDPYWQASDAPLVRYLPRSICWRRRGADRVAVCGDLRRPRAIDRGERQPSPPGTASAALTSFSNALAIALFGLVPGVGLRWPGFVVGLLGLLFVAASLLSLRRVRESQPVPPRDILFLGGLVAVFGLQVFFALRLISNVRDVGAARGIAILVIVCFFIGIARAWELVGGPSIGISHELMAIARVRDQNTPVAIDQQTAENVDKQ